MKKSRKKDHTLIFVNNTNACLLMISQLIKKKIKKNSVKIIIEKRHFKEKVNNNKVLEKFKFIKKIFKMYGYKDIFFYERPKNIEFFNLKNIFYCFKIKKKNLIHRNNLIKFFKKNKIEINKINEVWFSNDLLSKVFLNKYKYYKVYFFHGLGDIMNLKKKNFFLNFISFLKYKININFYNLYSINDDKNTKFFNFFFKEYNKNIFKIPENISLKLLKKIIFKISTKYKKIKFLKKTILITDNIILPRMDIKDSKKYSALYVSNLINFLNKNKIKFKEYSFFFKWKSTVPKMHREIFKKEFLKFKIIINDLDQYTNSFVPVEFLLPSLKPTYLTSYYSTINFSTKYLFPQTKIINTEKIHNLIKKEYLNYHHKYNLKKLLKNSETIKSLVKVPYDIKV